MSKKIHIEGMGAVGSLLALRLVDAGFQFTWSDTDDPITAWKASTGCAYPTGEPFDLENLEAWQHLLYGDTNKIAFQRIVFPLMERGIWCYSSKAPPHGGYKGGVAAVDKVGPVTLSTAHTYHFNVQKIVQHTRRELESRRRDEAPAKGIRLITHGNHSASRWLWGWSAKAKLKFSDEFKALVKERDTRPCLYLRKVYQMTYAYPVPGTSWFYIGTASQSQTKPKKLDAKKHLKGWPTRLEELTDGHVRIKEVKSGSLAHGWRPCTPEGMPLVTAGEGQDGLWTLVCRPMQSSGIRHLPALAEAVIEQLQKDAA